MEVDPAHIIDCAASDTRVTAVKLIAQRATREVNPVFGIRETRGPDRGRFVAPCRVYFDLFVAVRGRLIDFGVTRRQPDA